VFLDETPKSAFGTRAARPRTKKEPKGNNRASEKHRRAGPEKGALPPAQKKETYADQDGGNTFPPRKAGPKNLPPPREVRDAARGKKIDEVQKDTRRRCRKKLNKQKDIDNEEMAVSPGLS